MNRHFLCVRHFAAFFAAMSVVGSGCVGSETGNGREDHDIGEIRLSLAAPDSLGAFRAESGDGTVFFIDEAEVGVEAIDVYFEAVACPATGDVECGPEGKVGLGSEGWSADLIGGRLTPQLLLPADLPMDRISGFKVRWAGGDIPSLRLAGKLRLPNEVQDRAFDVVVDVSGVTHFKSAEDSVSGWAFVGWLLSLDPANWFEAVEVAACVTGGSIEATSDGILHLETGGPSCRDIVGAIARGFREDGRALRKN